jgi:hypothetical protein
MDITLAITPDLTLTISDRRDGKKNFPTSSLPQGLVLNYRGMDLAEEAIGFGLPVLKCGLQTFFPGEVALVEMPQEGSRRVVTATYTINLVEKIARPGETSINKSAIYAAKNILAGFIRQFPPARGILTRLSNELRRLFGWETAYEKAGFSSRVKMTYSFDEPGGRLAVEANWPDVQTGSVSEVIIMNEQGAHAFDQYRDSSGIALSGQQIGCWDEVTASDASFASSAHGIIFRLPKVAGARLFRGRELIGTRLAWAGFGYSISPSIGEFKYSVRLEKIP